MIGSAKIHRKVRYAAGGAPAERVLVRLERYGGGLAGQALTDRNGTFRFPGLERAQYNVTVRAAGYREATAGEPQDIQQRVRGPAIDTRA